MGEVDVTCPRCLLVRRVSRYSGTAAWAEYPETCALRTEALACRSCELIDAAERLMSRHQKVVAELAERKARGV